MKIKLYKRINRKSGKEYVSYFINLPKKVVELMSFTDANELELEVRVIDGRQCIVIYKP
ncbi:MAG: hypothetical protein QW290_08265 [Sulfolobales archaeon]